MFYSNDILGRRGPLGFIWSMAHGKKISKQKLVGIHLDDVCKRILAPDVPHSLRLQGILIGGVSLVFARQQHYLLEDLNDMMKHVKEATSLMDQQELIAATLKRGKDKARADAITLEDVDGMMDISRSGLEDALLLTMPDTFDGMYDDDLDLDMFVVPTLQSKHLSTDKESQGQKLSGPLERRSLSKSRSTKITNKGGSSLHGTARTEMSLGDRGGMSMDEEEAEFGAQGVGNGMELNVLRRSTAVTASGPDSLTQPGTTGTGPVGTVTGSRTIRMPSTAGNTHSRNMFMSTGGASERAARMHDLLDDDEMFIAAGDDAELMDLLMPTSPAGSLAADPTDIELEEEENLPEYPEDIPANPQQCGEGTGGSPEDRGQRNQQQPVQRRRGGQAQLGDGPPADTVASRAATKRRLSKKDKVVAVVDQVEDILVRVAVYRGWTLDTSDLVVSGQRPRNPSRLLFQQSHSQQHGQHTTAAATARGGWEPARDLMQGYMFGRRCAPGSELCEELASLYDHVAGRGREGAPGADKKRQRDEDGQDAAEEEEQANLEAGRLRNMHGRVDLEATEEEEQHEEMEEMDLNDEEIRHEENEWPHAGQHPPGGVADVTATRPAESSDVEMERLRAAGSNTHTPGSMEMRTRLGLMGTGSTNHDGSRVLATGGFGSRATSANTNSTGLSPETETGLQPRIRPMIRRAPGSSLGGALSPIHDGDVPHDSDGEGFRLRYGQGLLEDLLPAIHEGEGLPGADMLFDMATGDGTLPSAPAARFWTNPSNPSHPCSKLLESSGGPTQPPKEGISKNTMTVVRILKSRLDEKQLEQQQQQQAATEGGSMDAQLAPPPPPHVSFFDLVGGLKRREAIKLFYQVLVTHSTSYVKAEQAEPFGDIQIQAGRFM